jgi:hypothetical protein
MTFSVSDYERNVGMQNCGVGLSPVLYVPLDTPLLKIKKARFTKDEVNLHVVLINFPCCVGTFCIHGERSIRGKIEGNPRFCRLKINIQGMNVT